MSDSLIKQIIAQRNDYNCANKKLVTNSNSVTTSSLVTSDKEITNNSIVTNEELEAYEMLATYEKLVASKKLVTSKKLVQKNLNHTEKSNQPEHNICAAHEIVRNRAIKAQNGRKIVTQLPYGSNSLSNYWAMKNFYPLFALCDKSVTVTVTGIARLSDATLIRFIPDDEEFDYYYKFYKHDPGYVFTALPSYHFIMDESLLPWRKKFTWHLANEKRWATWEDAI